ncbi:13271_t:CDS:1 [Dentiscutata heterogama]|uniref:13271_t:CDS:1 n=1 Tax=Dentiscutata heterogama TaxID=1316150 RepID=A0ACA9JVD7_9GLOM|nr:13271_t:CDS:1 [Dentiscutata heterogama]
MSRTNWFNVIPLEIFDMIVKDHFITVFFDRKCILDFDPFQVFLKVSVIDTFFRERFLFLLQEAFEASEWKKEGYLMIENDMGKFEDIYVNFWTVFIRWVKFQNNYVEFSMIGPNKYFTRDINIFFKEVEDRIYSNIENIMQRIKKCKFASGNKEVCNLRGGWYANIRNTMYRIMVGRFSGGIDDVCNSRGGCFYEFKMCLWSLEYIYDDENETCLYFKEFHRLLKEANSYQQISKLIDLIDETLNSYGDYRFNVRKEIKKKIF